MADFLAATRDSYDTLAPHYLDLVSVDHRISPIDRAGHTAFADLVKAGGNGLVADVGCGPGWLTADLHQLGLDVVGIDLSPGMIAQASSRYPELHFEVGSMLSLDLADGALGGLVASYSIIHVPWDRRPELFAEFHRVLAPGGELMLAFQVGSEHGHRDEAWGRAVDLDWYRQQPEEVTQLLVEAGFAGRATVLREPENKEKTPQATILAHRPQLDIHAV
jgi:SAM-dependent methyltransferase